MSFLPSPSDLLLFVSAAVILLIIPGPAVLYVLARSIDQGRKAGLTSCSGIATGTLVHVLGAALAGVGRTRRQGRRSLPPRLR